MPAYQWLFYTSKSPIGAPGAAAYYCTRTRTVFVPRWSGMELGLQTIS
jgi:hypothetical protein